MSWVKYDDNFPDHPKLLALGKRYENGIAVHVAIASWCSRNLTDGRIPKCKANVVTPSARKTCQAMVEVGLLIDDGTSYLLNDYLEYNPSRQQVLALRKQNRERQSRHRNGVTDSVSVATPSPTPKEQRDIVQKTVKEKGDFEAWWAAYPRKQGKGAARTAYAKAITKTDAASLLAGVGRYASSKTVLDGFICLPSTWLNQERWEDDYSNQKQEVKWV